MAKAKGWAPGPIKDIETGAAGWLMWLGLALLLGDCFSELALLLANTACEKAVQAGVIAPAGQSGGSIGSRGWLGRVGVGVGQIYRYSRLSPDSAENFNDRYYHQQQQQQQQGSGLRSRSSSKSAVAGSNLELSPNSSTGNVLEAAVGDSLAQEQQQQQQQQQATGCVVIPLEYEGAAMQQQQQQRQLGYSYPTGDSSGRHLHQLTTGPSGSQAPPAATAAAAAVEVYSSDDKAVDGQAWLLSAGFWVPGLLLSTALATAILSPMLGMPFYEPLVAVVVALLVALLAVRALGQTDLNPVSGVGKISQVRLNSCATSKSCVCVCVCVIWGKG
jgi:hypothetical protein